ncbi:RNA polymerase sigma-70 factor (ECF subfamily) [Lacibacter cauensis]|uniref:RNA polymerase sigma-70 factor (ECF subfamily) n=1 Tax=Lacibacter cauensis TaxID=510947 RepID=A0A562SK45_9BACT|nr:sigma-70 family RNA polymerase sigma factor [Lacibacter cauensis]TWI81625.1 RNA polymerase sigma-70 factor (ECF subfamily) [Lacibacter cauensis]
MTTRTEQDFLLLVQEHQGIIRKVCHLYGRNDADRDDLYQEIVIQLWKAFGSFRGDAKISTWMYRIALNTAISNLRKQSRKVTLSFPEFIPKDEAETYEEKLKEEKLQQMYAAIGRLTEVEKAIVMLYLEDKSYDEMEEILGIGNGALRVKMNRIKEKLRSLTKAEAYGT